jgi:aspartate-semialdehyde dehydrogenase
LESIEALVRRHYQEIAGPNAPEPAVMLLQPPVFHGLALALFLEMERAVDRELWSQVLGGDHVTLVAAEDDSQPTNVNAAGQGNILVSLKSDAARPNGMWLWAAADNLRIAATTAVECAESMIQTRPVGKIQ